jgi:hypothetical protein
MPYLHWEIEEQLDKRKQFINQLGTKTEGQTPNLDSDQELLRAYLRDPHPLHIRRTLDQYYYHTLEDTEKRDKDQVVSRYQKKFPDETRVTTMVDQLWLWVLVGINGRTDTIITCFPQRTTLRSSNSNILRSKDPDPNGLTDVLRNILLHMLAEPSSVKTVYDLAGVITSECSRAYLNIASNQNILQFSEIYESSIGAVVSTFNYFSQNTTLMTFKDKTRNRPLRRIPRINE